MSIEEKIKEEFFTEQELREGLPSYGLKFATPYEDKLVLRELFTNNFYFFVKKEKVEDKKYKLNRVLYQEGGVED